MYISCTCAIVCILSFFYPQVRVRASILSSLHYHYIFRFICPCLHPCILIFLGLCVLACNLVSSHPLYSQVHVLCVLVGILASLHPHILRFMYSRYLLVSSHPLILISLGLCVLACNLVYSYPLILRFMYSACLLLSLHPYILHFLLIKFSRISYSIFIGVFFFQVLIRYLKANILHKWAALSR